jgi:hypothetical protein
MKRLLVLMAPILLLVAACGSQPTDGGWLASGSNWYMFLQIQDRVGSIDYAYNNNGQVSLRHGEIIVNNDNTVTVNGMVDGELKDCSACPYQISGGQLVISYQYQSYSGSGTVSGQMNLSSADISTYNNDVQTLNAAKQSTQHEAPTAKATGPPAALPAQQ